MENTTQKTNIRWLYLAVGTFAMLFAGILYAWSILKAPFSVEFGWSPSDLTLNFTITMSFFCMGGLLGAQISKRMGSRFAIVISGLLASGGFALTFLLTGTSVALLYLAYGFLAGLGIGISYNVVVATVSTWFPDKKGLCSGCLMMGFGASALVLGNWASSMFEGAMGWRRTYVILGLALGAVLILTGLILKRPAANQVFPRVNKAEESSQVQDFTSGEMLRRPSFWMAFFYLVCLSAVGSSVISFARDLALSVGAPAALATSLVGALSICNGLGRMATGAAFDALGRRKTMLIANCLTICAAGAILIAMLTGTLALCVLGLCLTGLSYGSCSTTTATFPAVFYGMKHYPTNVAYMTFNLMGGSLVATLSSLLLTATGGYVAPFLLLLGLTVVALGLNLALRKP